MRSKDGYPLPFSPAAAEGDDLVGLGEIDRLDHYGYSEHLCLERKAKMFSSIVKNAVPCSDSPWASTVACSMSWSSQPYSSEWFGLPSPASSVVSPYARSRAGCARRFQHARNHRLGEVPERLNGAVWKAFDCKNYRDRRSRSKALRLNEVRRAP